MAYPLSARATLLGLPIDQRITFYQPPADDAMNDVVATPVDAYLPAGPGTQFPLKITASLIAVHAALLAATTRNESGSTPLPAAASMALPLPIGAAGNGSAGSEKVEAASRVAAAIISPALLNQICQLPFIKLIYKQATELRLNPEQTIMLFRITVANSYTGLDGLRDLCDGWEDIPPSDKIIGIGNLFIKIDIYLSAIKDEGLSPEHIVEIFGKLVRREPTLVTFPDIIQRLLNVLNASKERGLSHDQIVPMIVKILSDIPPEVALEALTNALQSSLSVDQIVSLFHKAVKATGYYNSVLPLSIALKAATEAGLSPDRIVRSFEQIIRKGKKDHAIINTFEALPATLRSAKKDGLTPPRRTRVNRDHLEKATRPPSGPVIPATGALPTVQNPAAGGDARDTIEPGDPGLRSSRKNPRGSRLGSLPEPGSPRRTDAPADLGEKSPYSPGTPEYEAELALRKKDDGKSGGSRRQRRDARYYEWTNKGGGKLVQKNSQPVIEVNGFQFVLEEKSPDGKTWALLLKIENINVYINLLEDGSFSAKEFRGNKLLNAFSFKEGNKLDIHKPDGTHFSFYFYRDLLKIFPHASIPEAVTATDTGKADARPVIKRSRAESGWATKGTFEVASTRRFGDAPRPWAAYGGDHREEDYGDLFLDDEPRQFHRLLKHRHSEAGSHARSFHGATFRGSGHLTHRASLAARASLATMPAVSMTVGAQLASIESAVVLGV